MIKTSPRPCRLPAIAVFTATLVFWLQVPALADCSLTSTGIRPLTDMGDSLYKGFTGGLYPNGRNTIPGEHHAAGLDIAWNQIVPLDAEGRRDPEKGRIVLLSSGMSNTTQQWATGSRDGGGTDTTFKSRADADPAKNSRVVIVDGAFHRLAAGAWVDANSLHWERVDGQLSAAEVTARQVQVVWLKNALAGPNRRGAFPVHAQILQENLESIVRNIRSRFPNCKIVLISSRTRAYRMETGLSPEPYAFESGFATKWLIEKQIAGDPSLAFRGPDAPAPYVAWGPYLWIDGMTPRSDGATWDCTHVRQDDFIHPATNGVTHVAGQLLAFFKTHPLATPWFLRAGGEGPLSTFIASASVTSGVAPLRVQFALTSDRSSGTEPDYAWTFDDGTFSLAQKPSKVFQTSGQYTVHATVTDRDGNSAMRSIAVHVLEREPSLQLDTQQQH